MVALMLEQVMPKAVTRPKQRDKTPYPVADWPLRRLAARIARNREMLGLHYPSDSEIGKTLAKNSFPILLRCPSLLVGTPPSFDAAGMLRAVPALTFEDGVPAAAGVPAEEGILTEKLAGMPVGGMIGAARREWGWP